MFRDPFLGIFHVASYALVLEAVRDVETFSNRFAPAMGGAGLAALAGDPGARGAGREVLSARRHHAHGRSAGAQALSRPGQQGLHATARGRPRGRHRQARARAHRRLRRRPPVRGDVAVLGARAADRDRRPARRAAGRPAGSSAGPMASRRSSPAWPSARTRRRPCGGSSSSSSTSPRGSRRRESAPREDILSDLVRARLEGERSLDVAEMLSIVQQLLVAGNETTAAAIAEGLLLLVRHPEQLAARARGPVPRAGSRRGGAASRDAHDLHVAQGEARHRAGWRRDPGRLHGAAALRVGEPRRDALRRTPTASTCAAPTRASTSPSATASTSASARCSRARRWPIAFRTLLERLDGFRLEPGHPEPRHKPSMLLRGLAELHLGFEPRTA